MPSAVAKRISQGARYLKKRNCPRRPVSGNGALAVASDLMAAYGPDSYVGRVAAVMLGSTETTSSPGPASASITR